MQIGYLNKASLMNLQRLTKQNEEASALQQSAGVPASEKLALKSQFLEAQGNTEKLSTEMVGHLLNYQEVGDYKPANMVEKSYDFSNMTRGDIANAGKELFQAGKITLDELFRFEHPDGKLRFDVNGNYVEHNPNDKIDFVSQVKSAIQNMEATGEANRPDSSYKMMLTLLSKLYDFQV